MSGPAPVPAASRPSETGAAGFAGPPISDDELTELALAADPDRPLGPDAIPIDRYLEASGVEPQRSWLPAWYMAPVRSSRGGRRTRLVVLGLIAAFLLIEAFGLCSTYGQLPLH